ncbi:MAG: roadblock/LC7 domain-containing protein [Promethearchaeota archaeon]
MQQFSMSEEEAEQLATYLREITLYTDLETLAVVTKAGRRVAFSSIKGVDIDPDLLSAISAVLLQTGQEAVTKLNFNPLYELIIRGEKGIIVVTDAGPLVLIGAGVKIETLGHTVSVFRHFGQEIATLFAKGDH